MKRIFTVPLIFILIVSFNLSGCFNQANATDYSNHSNWAYFEMDTAGKAADVFFVCPTVYSGSDGACNMELTDKDTKASFLGATNMEKGIYERGSRFFAPYYNDGRQKQLIACYAIGWRITEEETRKYPQLKFARGESDTGVVISYNSEAENIDGSLTVPKGTKTLAINPLSWKTDAAMADKSLNLGACFTDYDGNITKEINHLTGAYIDDARGTLKVTDISPAEYPAGLELFVDGIYHLYDYQFFYRNLEKNVQTRMDAYLSD